MRVPFTHDQFLTVFADYNTALWPVAILLWIATLAGSIQLVRGRARGPELAVLLVLHWAWSGVAYHALYFTSINRAARVFAGLFVAQALAFAWSGVVDRRLVFDWDGAPRHALAGVLLVVALAYPALALGTVADWPRARRSHASEGGRAPPRTSPVVRSHSSPEAWIRMQGRSTTTSVGAHPSELGVDRRLVSSDRVSSRRTPPC